MKPWFERHPRWLAAELAALDAAGIRHRRDEDAFRLGRARLFLDMELEGVGPLALTVTFPDLYPYFRFEVQAHGLSLTHHQNPFEKNLCLLPRGSAHWEPTDTVAAVLTSQLPKVVRTARAERAEEVAGQEVPQAEPVSVFYGVHPLGMVVVQGGWDVPAEQSLGRLVVGTQTPEGARPGVPVRGAVLKILDRGGKTLVEADAALQRGFAGAVLDGMWVRSPAPILKSDPMDFLQELFDRSPPLASGPYNQVQGGFLKLWGVLFPEEVGHRKVGEGWMFVCHFEETVNRLHRKLSSLRPPAPGRR